MRKFLFIVMLLHLPWVNAAQNSETDQLARISREIAYIEKMVDEARQHADQSGRVRFDYDALKLDLQRVRLGIEDYTHKVERNPRTLSPVEGVYQE